VIFGYIWRKKVLLKGLVKLMEIGNYEDLVVDAHQTVAQQPGVPLWGRATVLWCSILFHNLFLPFNLSLNFLKFHLNSDKIPRQENEGS